MEVDRGSIRLNTDDELMAVALSIREANDLATALNQGFDLHVRFPSADMWIASNTEALLRIMFSDELETLKETLKRASSPGLPPLVQAWLLVGQFWAVHEKNRRLDAPIRPSSMLTPGHFLYLAFEDQSERPYWYWIANASKTMNVTTNVRDNRPSSGGSGDEEAHDPVRLPGLSHRRIFGEW